MLSCEIDYPTNDETNFDELRQGQPFADQKGARVFMTPEECRIARAKLGWSVAQLAFAAGLSLKTVEHFENGVRQPRQGSIIALRRVFNGKSTEEAPAVAGHAQLT